MKTLKFWFLMHTRQFEKAQEYAHELAMSGYGCEVNSWHIKRIMPKAEWDVIMTRTEDNQQSVTYQGCSSE